MKFDFAIVLIVHGDGRDEFHGPHYVSRAPLCEGKNSVCLGFLNLYLFSVRTLV